MSSFGVLQKVSEISEKKYSFFHAEPAIGKQVKKVYNDQPLGMTAEVK